ncbi:MAG: protein kinase domain-containing protein, partial [Candidatus Sumerlaeota bacterium]
GDLLLAAINYRKAGKLMEAATTFERMEEWIRAAKAYDELGLEDRAEIARMHAPDIEYEEESDTAGDAHSSRSNLSFPSPSEQSRVEFKPIAQAPQMPVFAALGMQEPASTDPAAQEDMLQLVRQGNFAAAAKRAEDANNWPMAAAFYECAGEFAKAADTYRRIGRIDEATQCLNHAGKRRESALLSIAEGREDKAVESLLEALGTGEKALEKQPLSFLLELLVDWGLYDQARELLEKRLAPLHRLEPETARYYFQLGTLLEKAQQYGKALEVFREMIDAGAMSEDVNQRVAALEQKMESGEGKAAMASSAASNLAPERKKAVEQVLTRVISEAPEESESLGPDDVTQTRAFEFEPGSSDMTALMGEGEKENASSLSLFGDPLPKSAVNNDRTKTIGLTDVLEEENQKETLERRQSDPFSIGERYERKKEIARGGMGVVYEAEDTLLRRPVALKLLLGDFGASPQGLQQFLVEARAIAQLSHPNVVMIYDIGLMDKRHYIAMELVKGGSLSGLVKQEKTLSLAESMRIFVEMARGLQTAHEAGIVHRDIKPANVLLSDKHQVKIVDFGLAKVAPENETENNETRFRTSGTPGYMAPEQIQGEPLMPRTDIYALGITLFQMIVGRAPHRVKNLTKEFDILNFQVHGEYPSLKELNPDIPEGIDKLYRYCAAQNPEDRYQSVDAFLPTAEGWLQKLQEKQMADI